MRINKLLKISAMMAFVFMLNQPGYAKSSAQEAYDKYISSYQAYQDAITSKKSNEEIQAAFKEYEAAKQNYTVSVGDKSVKSLDYETSAASPATTSSTDSSLNTVGIPSEVPAKSVIDKKNDIQRATDDLYNKLDKDVQPLVDELRDTQDKKRAQEIVKTLEEKIETSKDEDTANYMKYEVATALDRLSIDDKKSQKLLNELIATKKTRFVNLAKLNMNYRNAKLKKIAWQNDLGNKVAELNNTKASFKNASWLAFPVKIVRGVKSVVANVKFTSDEADYEDYMVQYEAIQANFITNVEAVFNEWQAKIADPEETADIRLIYGNYDAWYARWNLLSQAHKSIDVQYFIIEKDCFGLSLLGKLLEKAKAGVKIRLMVDTRGSNKLSILTRGYLVELAKNSNVEVRIYNPITSNVLNIFTDARKVESSNHDKIMIVDGERCIMGGRNIANTYLVDNVDMYDAWRDCDVVIDSEKICSQLKLAFDEEFESMKSYTADSSFLGLFTSGYSTKLLAARACMENYLISGDLLSADGEYKKASSTVKKVNKELGKYIHMSGYNSFALLDYAHRCSAHVLDNHSLTGNRKDITENIVKYIDGSRTEIIIQNPYFALTERAEAALKRAAKRGIPIYVHSNSERSSDSAPTEAYVLREWKNMLTEMPTMRFFARNADGQLHGKTFNFDGKVSVVGSYNFDALSEKVNSEVAVAIKSPEFSRELRECQMEDIEMAVEYKMASEGQEEFAPDDVDKAKNKTLIKVLTHFKFLDPMF
ncbi:MAG: phosphatidylserine/phosphatidylglycerophosphate/cardiolipin synthase family protein [Candidatus Riflebacteria bacterium]|nr:phosphatidylserine/phosphatidylglycerophosphate/cardiolipin synthase family protein [Candidatus Riflebacteria bacterium]